MNGVSEDAKKKADIKNKVDFEVGIVEIRLPEEVFSEAKINILDKFVFDRNIKKPQIARIFPNHFKKLVKIHTICGNYCLKSTILYLASFYY